MREVWARLDMGRRANALIDTRMAAVHDPKVVEEFHDKLMRFAL